MQIIQSTQTDPVYNLALEEALLGQKKDYILIWQNDNSVIVGRNQNIYAEVNRSAAAKYNAKIVRRSTGGGAVYHDLGNVNFSFCFSQSHHSEAEMLQSILSFLHTYHIPAEFSGRNDILVEGKKVSGCASLSREGYTLLHGTLLFLADPVKMEQLLNVSPLKLQAKGIRSIKSRVGWLKSYFPAQWDVADFLQALTEYLTTYFSAEKGSIPEQAVQRLMAEKYGTWEWNYGRNPSMNFSTRQRFPAGEFQVNLQLNQNRLKSCRFSGDFIGKQDLAMLEQKLVGIPYEENALRRFFHQEKVPSYLGSITESQWLSLMFPFQK